jgi:hypothetical protein
MYKAKVTVCSESHTKQHVEWLNITPGGTFSNRLVWKVKKAVNPFNVLKSAAVEHNGN